MTDVLDGLDEGTPDELAEPAGQPRPRRHRRRGWRRLVHRRPRAAKPERSRRHRWSLATVVTPRRARRVTWAILFLGAFAGLTALWRLLPFDDQAPPMPAAQVLQVMEAGRGQVAGAWVTGIDDDPFGYQVRLQTASADCYKVLVVADADAAPPVFAAAGKPAKVGCRDVPVAADMGGEPDAAIDETARGFVAAYTTGRNVTRWAEPGVTFTRPPAGHLVVDDVKQVADVGGPPRYAVVRGRLDGEDVQYRLTLSRLADRWVVAHVDAGPAVAEVESAPPTAPPPANRTPE